MSSRRSSHSRQSSSSPKITEDQIIDLISKLQALLPDTRIRNTDRVTLLLLFIYIYLAYIYHHYHYFSRMCIYRFSLYTLI